MITPAAAVPKCKPNLMPFHINYDGPAAVNTFMHVEKLSDNVKGSEIHGRELQTDKPPETTEKFPATDSGISAETQCLPITTSSDTLDSPLTLTRSTTESTLVTESSLTTLEGSTPDVSLPSSSSFSQFPTESQNPPIEDLDKRFISTFRGRSIHGLTIDLPEGYAGLVLKSTSEPNGKAGITSCGNGRDVQGTDNVDVDVEMESSSRRRRRGLRSSAAPRKGTVITISDDDDAPKSSKKSPDEPDGDDIDMAEPLSTPNELDGPRRLLVPTAQFDSFTLWQADRMVNKSNDEYWRTLTEWIGLAHEIHNTDI